MADEKYVVSSAEISAMEGLAKTHFLNPNGKRINNSLGDMVVSSDSGFTSSKSPRGTRPRSITSIITRTNASIFWMARRRLMSVRTPSRWALAISSATVRAAWPIRSRIRAAKLCAVSLSENSSRTMSGTIRVKGNGSTGTMVWRGPWSITAPSRNLSLAQRNSGSRRPALSGWVASVAVGLPSNRIVTV